MPTSSHRYKRGLHGVDIGPWSIGYGQDGILGKLHGWFVCYDGSVAVQLEKRLIVALWKTWRATRSWE